MNTKFSIQEYAADKTRMAFLCTCKTCNTKMTPYVSKDTWLDIAYVLVQDDLLTHAEFKNLNHLAVSQWDLIAERLSEVA